MGRTKTKPKDDLREAQSSNEVSDVGMRCNDDDTPLFLTPDCLIRFDRYYYKSKVLLPVFGRRLVYKFGPNATGWLPDSDGTIY